MVTEAGSHLRLIDSCITQRKAQAPSRTCNGSQEEKEDLMDLAFPGCSVPRLQPTLLRHETVFSVVLQTVVVRRPPQSKQHYLMPPVFFGHVPCFCFWPTCVGCGLWGLGFRRSEVRRTVKRFRGGLVFKAHRLLYHSTLGSRVIKKEEEEDPPGSIEGDFTGKINFFKKVW